MKAFVYIATSLDGFIARMDGSLDWLMKIPNPNDSDYGFNNFINSIDAIVMGRNTFNIVTEFEEWPYNKPVFVFTNTLKELDSKYKGKAEIISGDLESIIKMIDRKKFQNVYIDGGKTIQTFLNSDLIDEMIITTVPMILGSGIRLFDNINLELLFDIVKSEILDGEMIKTHFKRRNRTTVST
jgi:dihydrofolate reductase